MAAVRVLVSSALTRCDTSDGSAFYVLWLQVSITFTVYSLWFRLRVMLWVLA